MGIRDAPKRCCNYFQKTSTCWLYTINFLVGVIGIFTLISATVLAVQSGDIIAGLGSVGLVGPSIAGALIFMVSFMGCIGVYYRSRCLLVSYFLLMFAIAVFAIGVGVLLLFFIDDVNNVDGEASEDLAGTLEGQINDFIIALFNQCCAEEQIGIVKLLNCVDAAEGDACFTFIDTYQEALDRVKNSGVCDILENTFVEQNGQQVPVVGAVGDGGCAGGDGNLFVQEVSAVIQLAVQPLGGIILAIGILLLLAAVASCCLVCADKDIELDYNVASWDLRNPPRRGGEVVYGSYNNKGRKNDELYY